MVKLAKKYNHLEVEKNKYQVWIDKNFFVAQNNSSKPNFTIVLPPPNITGKLHLGHAWDGTLQDIIARYKRLKGFNVLWIPGKDHAGISMQRKVLMALKEKKVNIDNISKEKFLEAAWKWKDDHNNILNEQWAKLGLGLDYNKEKFTMDEDVSFAVTNAFVKMYNQDLIYEGSKVVNWDPIQKTAVSNMEVIHKEIEGFMYYFKYQVVNSKEFLPVATTRPETMFGDSFVVVNPKDKRFNKYIGQKVINPVNNQELEVVGDEYVSIEEGTGVMKCTPAHDFNDFELGVKHKYPMPICMNEDGTMNDLALAFTGLDRFVCRKKVIKEGMEKGYFIKKQPHTHSVGHSERSNAIIEPLLSKQWFVKMSEIKKLIKKDFIKDPVEFIPQRFNKTYLKWMDEVYDWCISREIMWGHKIPVWYHKETKEVFVSEKPPQDVQNWAQEEKVLDTWFSSGLWAFSVLGWPKDEETLQNYFPSDALVTGYDIIFFWVLRMIFLSQILTGQKPFKKVLIHGLIRDKNGLKMSKSLGNGVDPSDVIDQYGADALRYFLSTNSSPGLDLRYDETKVESSWNFINKIWNISRYVQLSVTNDLSPQIPKDLNPLNGWIINRLAKRLIDIEKAMENYEFGIASKEIYNFVYNELASVYIELSKVDIAASKETQQTLLFVLVSLLKILHPYIPFVTEHIYQSFFPDQSLLEQSYPQIKLQSNKANDDIDVLNELILKIRQIRAEKNIAKAKPMEISTDLAPEKITYFTKYCEKLINCKITKEKGENWDVVPFLKGSIYIDFSQYIDQEETVKFLKSQLEKIEEQINNLEKKLSNKGFITKAPQKIVAFDKNRLKELKQSKEKLELEIKK